jgi:hypothetical protein
MRPGGTEVPINGDVMVYRQAGEGGDAYVVRTIPSSGEGTAYRSYDEAVDAATSLAARFQVSVYYCDLPHAPPLLRPFRAF